MYYQIKYLYPEADEMDFSITDEGNGPFIEYWNENKLGIQPTQEELDAVESEGIKLQNSFIAQVEQDIALLKLKENNERIDVGLPSAISDESLVDLNNYVQKLQGNIDNPISTEVYEPPLPPGVTKPDYQSLTITVTRIEGWQGALGYKVELNSVNPAFTPGNLALAVYTNPNCTDYLYTTGAFVETDGIWGAVCPAGHEPGDIDINFGLLYGAAPISCWIMPSGQDVQSLTVFE